MNHIIPPRTSYIFSKRPGYSWIIGTVGLEDSRIDEADLTYTDRRAIQKMSERENKNTLALIRDEETSRNS